jgi:hypothetical protein
VLVHIAVEVLSIVRKQVSQPKPGNSTNEFKKRFAINTFLRSKILGKLIDSRLAETPLKVPPCYGLPGAVFRLPHEVQHQLHTVRFSLELLPRVVEPIIMVIPRPNYLQNSNRVVKKSSLSDLLAPL